MTGILRCHHVPCRCYNTRDTPSGIPATRLPRPLSCGFSPSTCRLLNVTYFLTRPYRKHALREGRHLVLFTAMSPALQRPSTQVFNR